MAINRSNLKGPEVERRGAGAQVLLRVVCGVNRFQLNEGRHFLHGHTAGARAWADAQLVALINDPAVGPAVGHHCMRRQKRAPRTGHGRGGGAARHGLPQRSRG